MNSSPQDCLPYSVLPSIYHLYHSFGHLHAVLVCSDYYNKILQTEWLLNKRSSSLTTMEAGYPRPRHHLLVPVSSHGRRGQQALWGLFHKGPNLLHEGSTLGPKHLLLLSRQALGFHHTNLGGHKHSDHSIHFLNVVSHCPGQEWKGGRILSL